MDLAPPPITCLEQALTGLGIPHDELRQRVLGQPRRPSGTGDGAPNRPALLHTRLRLLAPRWGCPTPSSCKVRRYLPRLAI